MVEIGLKGAAIPDAQWLAARLTRKEIGCHSLAACLRCAGQQRDANLKTGANFQNATPPTKRRDR